MWWICWGCLLLLSTLSPIGASVPHAKLVYHLYLLIKQATPLICDWSKWCHNHITYIPTNSLGATTWLQVSLFPSHLAFSINSVCTLSRSTRFTNQLITFVLLSFEAISNPLEYIKSPISIALLLTEVRALTSWSSSFTVMFSKLTILLWIKCAMWYSSTTSASDHWLHRRPH